MVYDFAIQVHYFISFSMTGDGYEIPNEYMVGKFDPKE
jgi:hypothetical protein